MDLNYSARDEAFRSEVRTFLAANLPADLQEKVRKHLRLKREDYVHVASKNLLDRLFDGRVAPLVAHFSERRKLSKKDIAELKRLIEEIDHDR